MVQEEKPNYVSGLGAEWGPIILNSQEELNISTEAIKADALNNCARYRVLIGGRSNNSDNWNMFSVPSYYIPNNGGKHRVA